MSVTQEDLQSFQTRIAERLRLAGKQDLSVSWLALKINGLNCLFPLAQANEIMAATTIIRVPYVKSWFVGAVSARGRIFGVADLADYLAQEEGQKTTPTERPISLVECTLIGLNAELNLNCVLLVNKVLGLRTSHSFAHHEPAASGAPACFGPLYRDVAGIAWQEIDLQNLSLSPNFLSISA